MTTRDQVVAEARSWIGTPYQHQASLKDIACDCIGLVIGVARAFWPEMARTAQDDYRFKGYGRPPNPGLLLKACDIYLDRIAIDQAQPGDIPLARIEIDPQHFGILSSIDPLYIVHAYAQAGRVVENRVDDHWRSLVVRLYRFRGLE